MVRERFWNTFLVSINKAWIWDEFEYSELVSVYSRSWFRVFGAWFPQILQQIVVLVWRLYQKKIQFLLKSLPLQLEHWVYDTRKVEEVCTYWVTGLCCPVSLTCSQVKWVCSSGKMTSIYLLRLSTVWTMLHHGSVWLVRKKMLLNNFMYFFGIFLLFFITEFVLLSFSFLFLIKYQISAKNINQSETWIGDFQLSAELSKIKASERNNVHESMLIMRTSYVHFPEHAREIWKLW